jgi:hypothetical protein
LNLEDFWWWNHAIWSWGGGDMNFQKLIGNNIYGL